MSEVVEKLKSWLDKVYTDSIHIACLELPILKILINENGYMSRENIIQKLQEYGKFERGALSFDHLWSQRFGKGEEEKILNELVEHDSKQAGDKKTKYKIKETLREELKLFINNYNINTQDLIETRLSYVSADKKKFNEICSCLNDAIKKSQGKLPLQTNIGTIVNLEKQNNNNYKITFNSEKSSYESITLENLYQFLFEEWRGNPDLGRDDNRITLFEAIKKYIEGNCNRKQTSQGNPPMSNKVQPLNKILYGPPGTGKTYHTINKALEIIFEKALGKNYNNLSSDDKAQKLIEQTKLFYEETKDEINLSKKDDDRELLKSVFEYFKAEKQGQIEFVTFHQSYGYEEFVEGIKAKTIEDELTKQKTITYEIEPGIFKQICEKAKIIESRNSSAYNFDENINIWKISLGDSQNSDDEYLFDYCIKQEKILLGFGDGLDFSDCNNREEIAKKLGDIEKYSFPPTAVNTLKNKMKKNDIVLISYGNRKLRAIAKIKGDYEHLDDDNLKTYVQSRSVEWLLFPNEPFSYEKILKKQFSQMSIYDIKSNVKIEDLRNLLEQKNTTDDETKNYVLIIDEINRGNISKIFGELITLIEESKRIGRDEEIRIKLPYSNESFGIPQNLYIIGTMNTADRSIAPIDTALRRRFVFEEMAPKAGLLHNREVLDEQGTNTGIELDKLLEAINTRVEYLYDRDHTIGHAYLIDVKTLDDLKFAFKNKIIPLLAEYFYEDWENIKKVLNDKDNKFIESKDKSAHPALADIDTINGKKIYAVSDLSTLEAKDFIKIYPKTQKQTQISEQAKAEEAQSDYSNHQ